MVVTVPAHGSFPGELCSECLSVTLVKLVFLAERFNHSTFHGDTFAHGMRGIVVLLDMAEFQNRLHQRRKDKRDDESEGTNATAHGHISGDEL